LDNEPKVQIKLVEKEPENNKGKQALGKVDVAKKALRIQDLGDKMGFAIQQYQSAQKKFEEGQDSYKEWQNIIKLLNIQIRDVQMFLAVAHHNMGIIHAGRKEYGKAEEKFNEAIKINPDYAMAYYNLAVVYKKLNQNEKAKQFYNKAKSLGYPPSSPPKQMTRTKPPTLSNQAQKEDT